MNSYLAKMGGIALVATGLFAGGYFTGRSSKIVVKDNTTHQADNHKETSDKTDVSTKGSDVTQEPKVVIKWKTVTEPGPGCVGPKITTEGEKTETAASHTVTGATDKHEEKVAKVDEHVKDTASHTSNSPGTPGWLFGVNGGVQVPALLGGTPDRQLVPFLPRKFSGGVSIERKVFSSVYAGVWVNSQGHVGAGVRIGF